MESKYLNKFLKVKDNYKLNGSRLLVELFEQREIKTASGLVVSGAGIGKGQVNSADNYKAVIGIVLMTGEGYVDSDGNDIPMETKVGNVVMLNDFGLRYYSDFPGLNDYSRNTIAVTAESEVQMKFDSIEAFEAFEKTLNEQ